MITVGKKSNSDSWNVSCQTARVLEYPSLCLHTAPALFLSAPHS